MKFQVGDLVEFMPGTDFELAPGANPRARGTVVHYMGHDTVDPGPNFLLKGHWWDVNFDGLIVHCSEGSIRKVPPDPGREVVEFNWRRLTQPVMA